MYFYLTSHNAVACISELVVCVCLWTPVFHFEPRVSCGFWFKVYKFSFEVNYNCSALMIKTFCCFYSWRCVWNCQICSEKGISWIISPWQVQVAGAHADLYEMHPKSLEGWWYGFNSCPYWKWDSKKDLYYKCMHLAFLPRKMAKKSLLVIF